MASGSQSVIIWFRRDLRLSDNRAVSLALKHGLPIIPLYIWDDVSEGECARLWLHEALIDLDLQLKKKGTHLILRRGNPEEVLLELCRTHGVKFVYWNSLYEDFAYQQDVTIRASLSKLGVDSVVSHSGLLDDPDNLLNKQGNAYKVFTPYYKALRAILSPRLDKPVGEWLSLTKTPKSESVEDMDFIEPWGHDVISGWKPTREGALEKLQYFIQSGLGNYAENRDYPAIQGTSRLSPYLHFGQLSPAEVFWAIESSRLNREVRDVYIRQLIWREFSHYILHHYPQLPIRSLDEDFERYPWMENSDHLAAWRAGQTGYPLADAAMRQLWQTGWMHNRLRMLVASFLVKDLLQDWRHGYRWFMDTLLDADVANNAFGWQWIAGCGCDAAPYFRIFNPHSQSEKFDGRGAFIRKYVPELSQLPDEWIHNPSEAPEYVLKSHNITLGDTYPRALVIHKQARESALKGYYSIKGKVENGNFAKKQ